MPFEGVALFVDDVFRLWNLRKLYLESLDFNVAQLASGLGELLRGKGRSDTG